MAVQGDGARLDFPYTGGFQLTVDWRRTWRSLEARQAGSSHALVALKSHRSEEGLGVQWGLGGLGAATEVVRPRLGGPESSAANTQDTARLGVPYTGGAQITVDWRTALRGLGAWRVGSCHARTTAKAVWSGGGG